MSEFKPSLKARVELSFGITEKLDSEIDLYLEIKLSQLKTLVKKLIEVNEFYADTENYDWGTFENQTEPVIDDNGKRARELQKDELYKEFLNEE